MMTVRVIGYHHHCQTVADLLHRAPRNDSFRVRKGVYYKRQTACPPHVVFKLVDENEDAFRYPHAKLMHIAGMVRHLAIERMKDDPPGWIDNAAEWVNRVLCGHRDQAASGDHRQFSYMPLPSIGHAHADAMIRNVMIVAPFGMERELDYLAERLNGQLLEPDAYALSCKTELTNLQQRVELQKITPSRGKFIAEYYLGTARVWETVTPVILDGRRQAKLDDAKAVARTTERLIRKALARAGIEVPCEFTWQMFPFFKNALSAHERDMERRRAGYFRQKYLQGRSAVHVRLSFGRRAAQGNTDNPCTPIDVSGPLAIGAGRHCGFGLFAAVKAD